MGTVVLVSLGFSRIPPQLHLPKEKISDVSGRSHALGGKTPPDMQSHEIVQSSSSLTVTPHQAAIVPESTSSGFQFKSGSGRPLATSMAHIHRAAALFADIDDGCTVLSQVKPTDQDENAVSQTRHKTTWELPTENSTLSMRLNHSGESAPMVAGTSLFRRASGKGIELSEKSKDCAREWLSAGDDEHKMATSRGKSPTGAPEQTGMTRPELLSPALYDSRSAIRQSGHVPNTDQVQTAAAVGAIAKTPENYIQSTPSSCQGSFPWMRTPENPKDSVGIQGSANALKLETGAGTRVHVSRSGVRRVKARLGMPSSGCSTSSCAQGKNVVDEGHDSGTETLNAVGASHKMDRGNRTGSLLGKRKSDVHSETLPQSVVSHSSSRTPTSIEQGKPAEPTCQNGMFQKPISNHALNLHNSKG